MDTNIELKIRLLQLGLKQIDVMRILASKGIIVDTAHISRALAGCPQERYKKIRSNIEMVLDEKEKEKE